MSRQHYELKIESGISGGAMALYNGAEIVDQWINDSPTSKSDFLLEAISLLLERNKINAGNIEKIVFAENTRSQTAYKIAVSTFKGISIVSGTEVISKNLFECISAYFAEEVQGEFLVILQSERERFEFAFFNKNRRMIDSASIKLDALPEMFETSMQRGKFTLLSSTKFEEDFFERYIRELKGKGIESIELGKNLSIYL